MTRIDFYFNVVNKTALMHDLLETALLRRRQVTIAVADEVAANAATAALWQEKIESFLPNIPTSQALAAQTPIVIHWQNQPVLQDELLINLSASQLGFFSQFTQLIEMVGDDEQDKVAARARYKFYRDRGYEIKNIDQANIAV